MTLQPITKENWEDAIELKVQKDQEKFMASNLYSIAEVQFLENFQAMGIYVDEKMVGFTLFGIDPDDGNYWIYRLMIDQHSQEKGYGKKAVSAVINQIKQENTDQIPCIMIGYHPDNEAARQTYKRAGFIETEKAPWGEQLAKFAL
jgi:diamine N-acetyltransferase